MSAVSPATVADRVLRAMTDDDTFRVMVAVTTQTVRGALEAQRATGSTALQFANLLTGTVLIRETMAPAYRVQAILKGSDGRGSLVVDAHPDGLTRGLVQRPKGSDQIDIGPGSSLQMMRSTARGKIFRSMVEVPSDSVAEALQVYLKTSEQIVSVIATGVSLEGGEVRYAGGYVVQLLPGAARGPLMVMIERLEAMAPIGELLAQTGGNARALLGELLYRMPYAELDDSEVRHGCRCSESAVLASLATLPRDEIADMMEAEEVLEISCDYCNRAYEIASAQLQGLLATS